MMSNQKKILIFDDDPDILELCEHILFNIGFEVFTRERCDDLIRTMQELQPDLVLMDNWIPDIGGIQATRLIKQHPHFKNIPVVYFSANNDVKKLAEVAGADDYIAKPFDLEDFESIIIRALKRAETAAGPDA